MSYCVNCGVELEKSEKKCPLCGVEVINPAQPPEDKEPRQRPYPNRIEELSMNINKQFAAALLSVFMVFAAAICCVCNIIIDKSITWSQYVIGAIFFTWVVVTVPLIFKRAVLIKSLVLDIAALLLFLFMVSRLDGSRPLPAYRGFRRYISLFCRLAGMEHFRTDTLRVYIYPPAYPQAHPAHKAGIKKTAPYLSFKIINIIKRDRALMLFPEGRFNIRPSKSIAPVPF